MRKAESLHGFLMLFSGLIALGVLVNFTFFHGHQSISFSDIIEISTSQATLTHFNHEGISDSYSIYYTVLSLAINQLSGVLFLAFLLLLYWRLIHPEKKNQNLAAAFKLTLKVSILCEFALFFFFLYSIPLEFAYNSFWNKILASLTLSINSFNNAGLPHINNLLVEGAIPKSFIIQIGIIGGNTVGSLGIFVVDELLNPKNLRRRLENPQIDWSPITKLSIFGAAFMIISFSMFFYFHEKNVLLADFNLVEAIIASAYETSSARGFGYSLFGNTNNGFNTVVSFIGAGPFSTGGAFTLLGLLSMFSFLLKKHLKSMEWQIMRKLSKNLFIYLFAAFCILALIHIGLSSLVNSQDNNLNLWLVFSTNRIEFSTSSPWFIDIFNSIVNITGRLSLIVVCYITLAQIKKSNAPHLL